MYGELTDKETVARVEYALEHQQHDQFEILLYKKNSKYEFFRWEMKLLWALGWAAHDDQGFQRVSSSAYWTLNHNF